MNRGDKSIFRVDEEICKISLHASSSIIMTRGRSLVLSDQKETPPALTPFPFEPTDVVTLHEFYAYRMISVGSKGNSVKARGVS